MARTVTAHLFSSLNGVSESPNLFQFDAFGEEEGQLMGATLAGVTDAVMGRVLWEEWSHYWPENTEDGFGDFINPVRKHVITSSGSGDLAAYVRELAAGEGGGIVVTGGVETVRRLFLAGVIDKLTLTIHPAITGEGRRLFDESIPLTRLELLDSVATAAGNAVLTYRLRD